jgi:hypothetical protein
MCVLFDVLFNNIDDNYHQIHNDCGCSEMDTAAAGKGAASKLRNNKSRKKRRDGDDLAVPLRKCRRFGF